MTVIEVHPEELLDRELRGTLTERESHLLMAHLRRCSACRMERQLRADFERELAVTAQSLDLQMFVSDAIDAIAPAVAAPVPVPMRMAAGAGRSGWYALRPVAVLILVCVTLSAGVGIGAAQLGLADRAWRLVRDGLDATFGAQPAAQPKRTAAARSAPGSQAARASTEASVPGQDSDRTATRDASPRATPPLPAAGGSEPSHAVQYVELEPAVPASAQAAAATAEPRAASAARTVSAGYGVGLRPASGRDLGLAPGDQPGPAKASQHSAQPAPASAPPAQLAGDGAPAPIVISAARLFEEANTARHAGHVIEASRLYRELQALFAHSAEARLSVAMVARLELDQGEDAAALAGFDAYLASSDMALREEAMVGRVRALQRLQRDDDARSAAQTLLELYPNSAFAAAARKLLEPPAP